MGRLLDRLDWRLGKVDVFAETARAEELEFDWLYKVLDALDKNMTLSETTEDAIARKEAWFGVELNEGKRLNDRVAVLVAKHRGQGTTTEAFIRNVALSFEYGDIFVDDSSAAYTVVIIFNDVMGVPANLDDFYAAINEVMPAHLAVDFVFRYLTWDMYEGYNRAWDEWEAVNVTWDELEVYDGKVGA